MKRCMSDINVLATQMPDVGRYRQMLKDLSNHWEVLAIFGQMSGASAEMDSTRDAFDALSTKLLE